MELEFGLDTFGDVTSDAAGKLVEQPEVLRQVLEQAVLADTVGVDFFGVGEHHRDDFAIAAPEVMLAGIATRTRRIRLGSSVTVLSSDDPIRVFERFATIDALSLGRAEVTLGRGSFTESFPLFGYDLNDYELLFNDKLSLFVKLIRNHRVTWQGKTRPPLHDQPIWPPVAGGSLRTWVGVGGSPESVLRAARNGLWLMLAIIGGQPARFRPYVDLYRRTLVEAGQEPLPVGAHSPGFVAATDAEARDRYFDGYRVMHARIARERGWPPMSRADFDCEVDHGAMHVGSPETVARKIAQTVQALGLSRFQLKYTGGPLHHDHMLEAIELYGRRVIPMVRELLGGKPG